MDATALMTARPPKTNGKVPQQLRPLQAPKLMPTNPHLVCQDDLKEKTDNKNDLLTFLLYQHLFLELY